MLRVALTGGIASGKSTVSNLFAAFAVPIIDADIASREVVKKNTVGLMQLTEQFGTAILHANGELNRSALRSIIFSDHLARARVNQILHPLIRAQMQVQAQQQRSPYCLFVIPLLLESGQANEYDHIIVVHASRDTRIKRLCARDKISVQDAENILAAQTDDDARLSIGHHIIQNDGDSSALTHQVQQLHQLFLQKAITG